MSYSIRDAGPNDAEFLTEMLVEASDWQNDPGTPGRRERALAKVKVARYIEGWQRPGDVGLVAVDTDGGAIGATWLRLFTAEEPAFGFVAEDVPELAIGIVKAWRGKGVGRALFREALRAAWAGGVERVSLSVDHANPARRLYLSEGFVVVESRETADTMVKELG